MKVLRIICLLAMIIAHQRSADAMFGKAKLHPTHIDSDDDSSSDEGSLMMTESDEIPDESDENFSRSLEESDLAQKKSHKPKPLFPGLFKALKPKPKTDAAKLLIAKKEAKKRKKLLKKLLKKQKKLDKKAKKSEKLTDKKKSKANKGHKEKEESEEDIFKGKKIVAMRECDRPSGYPQPRPRAEMPVLVPSLEPVAAFEVHEGPCWNACDDCLET